MGLRKLHRVTMAEDGNHLHVELRDLDAAVFWGEMVPVAPLRLEELGTLDYDLGEMHALTGVDFLRDHIDARAESKHQPCVRPVKD